MIHKLYDKSIILSEYSSFYLFFYVDIILRVMYI